MKIFIGAAASNPHLHQIGRAMDEAGILSDYLVPCGGFPLRNPMVLARRSPAGVPKTKLLQHPGWEITRLAASKLGLPASWVDLIWEQGELSFDRACSHLIASRRPNAFLGVEHAALDALRTARRSGIAAGLIYTSLHHRFREKWLNPELDLYPELLSPASRVIRNRDARRDQRRDEEMRSADFIHANSAVTARSLAEAGFPADRIITVPLGAPPAVEDKEIPWGPPSQATVIFVGNVALHKGAHHLLEAWRKVGAGKARLDLYGAWALPEGFRPLVEGSVHVHGHVSPETVRTVMRNASVLVLPSICDGFGMVITEAMAQGLPVICSTNAGASQLVVDGVNGFVVPAADPQRLAVALSWCLDNPERLHEMRRGALETARRWTWADFRSRLARDLSAMLERIGKQERQKIDAKA
jgi:glycosyltransferase involved in cell wall biosynthesis